MNDAAFEHADDGSRRPRRELWLVALVALGVFLFAVFEARLPQISGGQSLMNHLTFFLLINLNILLLVLFVFLVGRNLVKLLLERRRRILGSHLRTRLVLAFVALSLFPALLLFMASTNFVQNSIEKWFDVQVERSLESSHEIVESYYRQAATEAAFQASALAGKAAPVLGGDADAAAADLDSMLREHRELTRLGTVAIFAPSRELLGVAFDPGVPEGTTVGLDAAFLEKLRQGDPVTRIIPLSRGEIVRAAAPVRRAGRMVAVAVADVLIPSSIAQHSGEIERSFREYSELKILKQPVKNTYLLTLTLITLIVVFAATWYGLSLAKGITVPIQRLAEGTREVAQGNWDVHIEGAGGDEIGVLIGSFNQMTADLKKMNTELEDRRRHMETILANIRAGVVSISPSGTVTTWNVAAERLLGMPARAARGRLAVDVLAGRSLEPVRRMVDELLATGTTQGERQVEVLQEDRALVLLAAAAPLRDPTHATGPAGAVLFFEDITEILKVQRMEAWREVAQRIAHEIKNPLTPIQLAAQRLQKRYAHVVREDVFEECTRTIVQQVEDLKTLVNEFSNFARLPAGNQRLQDLNEIVDEAVVLFREGRRDIAFEVRGDPELPPLMLDREGVKRALINMLDNAVAACSNGGSERPRIDVSTQYLRSLGLVRLELADNGAGMTPEVKARLFEPYFSTKKEGTGLGLAIVSAILNDHRAFVRVRDNEPRGSRFIVEFPVGGEQHV